jgi:5-methylcytosine-specific restriction protein A
VSRLVAEWVGKDDNTPIPPRVKVRIFDRDGGKCVQCTRKLGPGLPPRFDHRPALINGGQNRESKIFAVCETCHSGLTESDVAEKSKVYAVRAKHLGAKPESDWKRRYREQKAYRARQEAQK